MVVQSDGNSSTSKENKENDVGMIEIESTKKVPRHERGAVGWAVLWLLGIPIPLLLIFFVLRGCT